jgi:hypothetical protein
MQLPGVDDWGLSSSQDQQRTALIRRNPDPRAGMPDPPLGFPCATAGSAAPPWRRAPLPPPERGPPPRTDRSTRGESLHRGRHPREADAPLPGPPSERGRPRRRRGAPCARVKPHRRRTASVRGGGARGRSSHSHRLQGGATAAVGENQLRPPCGRRRRRWWGRRRRRRRCYSACDLDGEEMSGGEKK